MTMTDVTTCRFTRSDYERMIESGVLDGKSVEWIDGEILQMSPMNNSHMNACALVSDVLREAFGKSFFVRVQGPLAIGDSEPQPDVAVVPGAPRDYSETPDSALLVVEVFDATLRFDRTIKASLYASAGIKEYWLLNLQVQQLERHLSPKRDRSQRFGYRYNDIQIFKPKDVIRPLAAPAGTQIRIADMLP